MTESFQKNQKLDLKKRNKYGSQMTIQNNNNNLNYLIDPTFTNFNRLFVLSFARDNAGDNRDSFSCTKR